MKCIGFGPFRIDGRFSPLIIVPSIDGTRITQITHISSRMTRLVEGVLRSVEMKSPKAIKTDIYIKPMTKIPPILYHSWVFNSRLPERYNSRRLTNTPLMKTAPRLNRLLKNFPVSSVRRATEFDKVNRRVPCAISPATASKVKISARKLRMFAMISVQSILKKIGKMSAARIGGKLVYFSLQIPEKG